MDELIEAERWLLLSLDADSPFWDLLSPITRHDGAKAEQIRPALETPEAMQALGSLVSRGLVEVYDVGQQADEWVRVPDDGVQAVITDQANWQGTWEESRYRAVSTPEPLGELLSKAQHDLDPILWGNLKRLNELGILRPDEILVELELAGLASAPGALIVTDQRVLFHRASPLSRKTSLVSLPLVEIEGVEARERRSPIRKAGVLTVIARASAQHQAVVFDHIPGGLKRAEQIAQVIRHQRKHAQDPTLPSPNNARDRNTETIQEEKPSLELTIGRGVESFVVSNGGRLYVWGKPFGGMSWMKASTDRPRGVAFTRFENVTEFELYIEGAFVVSPRLRLSRRRLLRAGIVVDTGTYMGP